MKKRISTLCAALMATLSLCVGCSGEDKPKYEINYTTSDGQVINLDYRDNKTDIDFCGANIVSNTYEDGQGKITFDAAVTKIGERAFSNCYNLTSFTIPNSVTEIEPQAFFACASLTSVEIPSSATKIGSSAFSGCKSLTSVTIGNSVTEIETGAFECCSSLRSVEIPNSVTKIGPSAFNGCSSLRSVTIGNSVTEINPRAFFGCKELTEITSLNTTPPYSLWGMLVDDSQKSSCVLKVPAQSVKAYQEAEGWCDIQTIVGI